MSRTTAAETTIYDDDNDDVYVRTDRCKLLPVMRFAAAAVLRRQSPPGDRNRYYATNASAVGEAERAMLVWRGSGGGSMHRARGVDGAAIIYARRSPGAAAAAATAVLFPLTTAAAVDGPATEPIAKLEPHPPRRKTPSVNIIVIITNNNSDRKKMKKPKILERSVPKEKLILIYIYTIITLYCM